MSLLATDAKTGVTNLSAMTAAMTASGIDARRTSNSLEALNNELLDMDTATELAEAGLGGISTVGGKVTVDFKKLFESAGDDFEKYAQLMESDRAKLAFRTLAGSGESAFLKMSEGFEDVSGRSENAFNIMQDTSEAATNRLGASWNEVMISVGGAADSMLTDMANTAAGALQTIADWFTTAEQEAAEAQEHFNQTMETATAIGDSIATVNEAIAAAREEGADETAIVAEQIKIIGETAQEFKDEFPVIADNIERIINTEGEMTVETLEAVNDQLMRMQELSKAEAFLSGMEATEATLEASLERFNDMSDVLEDVIPAIGLMGTDLEDLPDAAGALEVVFRENQQRLKEINEEMSTLDLNTEDGAETARELREEYRELSRDQQVIGKAQLSFRTEIEKVLSQQIKDGQTLAELNKTEFDLTTTIENARQDLLDTFGDEGKTLELINDLTSERLDTEKDIENAVADQVDEVENVTDETEETLAANKELEDVLNAQVDISAEKSAIESEINDMTSEILDNEELTTEEKIAQLQEMENALQVELNMLNAKINGKAAETERAIAAAAAAVAAGKNADAEWERVDALKAQIVALKEQAAIVASAQTELQGKITETEAGAAVGGALAGAGLSPRSTRDAERAERERQREAEKAEKEAEKAEKARQKELDKAEKERIKQEEEHTQALKEAQEAQLEQIEKNAEIMREMNQRDHERRMEQIERQQQYEEEQRKLNEERIQREKELNERLTQVREQQLGELRGIAASSSMAIQDIIRSIVPLTKREQLQLSLTETDKALSAFATALENSHRGLQQQAKETAEAAETPEQEWGRLGRTLDNLSTSISSTNRNIGTMTQSIELQIDMFNTVKEAREKNLVLSSEATRLIKSEFGAYAQSLGSMQQFIQNNITSLDVLKNTLEEQQTTYDNANTRYKELTQELQNAKDAINGMRKEAEALEDVAKQISVADVINEQTKLAQQLAVVTNEFQGITDLVDGLFTQEDASKAAVYFDTLFARSENVRVQMETVFPGLLTNFQNQLTQLNEDIARLTEAGEGGELLIDAVKNAEKLEFLISVLTGELVDINNEVASANLEFAQQVIDSESAAADAITSIQSNIQRFNEQNRENQFATQSARVNAEIEANKQILNERKQLLEQLLEQALSVPLEEQDFERILELNQQVAEIETNLKDLEEIEPELITEAHVQTLQDFIDGQKTAIDQQEKLGKISGVKALRKRLDLIDEEIALARERGDEEEEINELLIERQQLEENIFKTQLQSLKNISENFEKMGSFLEDFGNSVAQISGLFRTGQTAAGAGTISSGQWN
jgi:hypothetical protein